MKELNLEKEFIDIAIEDNTLLTISDLENQTGIDSIVGVVSLETSILSTEAEIKRIEQQQHYMDNISAIANEDQISNTNTRMIMSALEHSALELGASFCKDNITTTFKDSKYALQISIEAKDSFTKKTIAVLKKLYVKLSVYVRRLLLKIITTVNFNKSNLEKNKKILRKNKDLKFDTNNIEEKLSKKLGNMFGTMGILYTEGYKFKLNDTIHVTNIFSSSNTLSRIKDYSEIMVDAKTEDEMLKKAIVVSDLVSRTTISELGKSFLKQVDKFNLSENDLELLKKDINIEPLRYDGFSITMLITPKNKDVKNIKVITVKLKKDIIAKLEVTALPTTMDTLYYTTHAMDANKKLKDLIDKAFIDSDNIVKASEEIFRNVESLDEVSEEYVTISEKIYLLSPKLAMSIVLKEYKNIRNMVLLGNEVIKVRELIV